MLEIISATRLNEDQFWASSPLGLSLKRLEKDKRIVPRITYGNRAGLPSIYNNAITGETSDNMMAFVHDDVWIDDFNFFHSVSAGLREFDVIGVAGNKRRVHGQPSWMFTDTRLEADSPENLSGSIANGEGPFGSLVSYFGLTAQQCELLDGVILATRRSHLVDNNILFDPRFMFHFYDLDFCRQARAAGLILGTWPIAITHQSTGKLVSVEWLNALQAYLGKYDEFTETDDPENSCKEANQTFACNQDLLVLLHNLNPSRVIEVGSGPGELCRAYLSFRPECAYDCIEINDNCAAIARNYCRHMIIADVEKIEDCDWQSLFPSDVWVFGDSLEHLRDPWSLLKRVRESMNQTGVVLACIPNAQHWSILLRLASGQFFYEEQGLMDSTHLRWFTRNTIHHMFMECGFLIQEIYERVFDDGPDDELRMLIGSVAEKAGADSDQAIADCLPLQYVVRATCF